MNFHNGMSYANCFFILTANKKFKETQFVFHYILLNIVFTMVDKGPNLNLFCTTID